jgi:uncharacterized protein
MRRTDKEIKNKDEILAIIKKATIMRLAMSDKDSPYLVPLNFGYRDESLFFHCAKEGSKLDIIRQNPKVCFEFETDVKPLKKQETLQMGNEI